eukprot:Pgem_evm1s11633
MGKIRRLSLDVTMLSTPSRRASFEVKMPSTPTISEAENENIFKGDTSGKSFTEKSQTIITTKRKLSTKEDKK